MSTHNSQEYLGNGKHLWEQVTGETSRLRVPGGWLYAVTEPAMYVAGPVSFGASEAYIPPSHRCVVFVPMPEVVKYKV